MLATIILLGLIALESFYKGGNKIMDAVLSIIMFIMLVIFMILIIPRILSQRRQDNSPIEMPRSGSTICRSCGTTLKGTENECPGCTKKIVWK